MILRPGTSDSARIRSFFDVLERMVGLPEAARAEIREELEAHVRDRVRDLVLAGEDEDTAVQRALDELGEASALARRLRRAHTTPRRRLRMHIALFGIAGASLVLSLGSLARTGGAPQQSGEPVPVLSGIPVIGHHFQPGSQPADAPRFEFQFSDAPLQNVLAAVAQAAGSRAVVHWGELGLQPGDKVTVELQRATVAGVLDSVNQSFELSGYDALDVRVRDGIAEFAPKKVFDLRDREIRCYQLDELVDLDRYPGDEIPALLQSLVEVDAWVDHGGEIGEVHKIGDTLFIKAPPRMHEQVQWVLKHLARRAEAAADANGVLELVPRVSAATDLWSKSALVGSAANLPPAMGFDAGEAGQVLIVHLQHAPAHRVAAILAAMMELSGPGEVAVVEDPRTNSVALSGARARAAEMFAQAIDAAFRDDR